MEGCELCVCIDVPTLQRGCACACACAVYVMACALAGYLCTVLLRCRCSAFGDDSVEFCSGSDAPFCGIHALKEELWASVKYRLHFCWTPKPRQLPAVLGCTTVCCFDKLCPSTWTSSSSGPEKNRCFVRFAQVRKDHGMSMHFPRVLYR